ncbi:MAG TPA: site-2 protease family protein [Dehalococcoidia bacterium]|nr:site-2 protease family protein [Dehalococcoidia bacterium]
MGWSIRLGSIFGIPVRLHFTWFIIFGLILVSLATQYFPYFYPGWSGQLYWLMGLAASLLFFASVLAHELSHSLVSKLSGIPVHSITLFIFGGVARISRESTRPSRELAMAAAGPLCSLFLGGLFALTWRLSWGINEPLFALTWYLAFVNILVALFNLIPGFPLDGGRLLRAIMWGISGDYRGSTLIAIIIGRVVAYALMIGGLVLIFYVRQWITGLWLVFIGFFLENAAASSQSQLRFRDFLRGVTARDIMTTDCLVIPRSLTLRELIRDYVLPSGRRCFMVADEGRLEGLMTLHNVKSVPERNWDSTTVAQVMTPVQGLKTARPEDEVVALMERMDAADINQMPVV